MTIEQFHELYDSQHGYEYWFGKPFVQKRSEMFASPTKFKLTI